MNARGVVVVLALCVFTCSMPALSAADGWLPGFSGGESTSTATSKKSSSSSWWPWSSSKKPQPKSRSKPSALDKIAGSTKSAWSKTVDFLNPFDDEPARKSGPRGSMPNTGNWFTSSKPEDKPSSVPEWMAGERPTF